MNLKGPAILGAMLAMLVAVSTVHGAGAIYSSPGNITLNQSSSLIKASVSVFSTKSLTVTASSNSSGLLFSTSKFNLTNTTGYNFVFYANASSQAVYGLTFSSGNYSLLVPVYINARHANKTQSVSGYAINIFGNVASNNQIVVYVTLNGSTVTAGNLFIQYNNVSDHLSLSTINSFDTLDLPALYGNVIFEYVTPSGQLIGPKIIAVANSSRLPNSQVETLTAYCSGKESNIQGTNNTIISTYTITPLENITCLLYNENTASYVSGVALQVYANGLPSRPYETDDIGEAVIPYPQGGWPIGLMALKPASKLYNIGLAYFNVVQMPNPLRITFNGKEVNNSVNGDEVTINPETQQNITINFGNGTSIWRDTSMPFNLNAVGIVSITATNATYSTFSAQVDFLQTQLTLASQNGTVIYPFKRYWLEVLNQGGQVATNFSSQLLINGQNIQFNDGIAERFMITNDSLSVSSPNPSYAVTNSLLSAPLPIYVVLPQNIQMGQIYTFQVDALNTSTPIPYTGSIYMTQDNHTQSIPVVSGTGTVSFSSADPVKFFSANSSVSLPSQTEYPINGSGLGVDYIAGIVAAIAVCFVGLGVYLKFFRDEDSRPRQSGNLNVGSIKMME